MSTLNPKWEGVVRHVLSLIGGVLIIIGVDVDVEGIADALVAAIGGVVTIVAFVASFFAKEKRENVSEDALAPTS